MLVFWPEYVTLCSVAESRKSKLCSRAGDVVAYIAILLCTLMARLIPLQCVALNAIC